MATNQLICLIVNVLPAIVTVPLLSFLPRGVVALYATDPLPVPLAPDVIVIQSTLLLAVQAQPLPVDTVTEPLAAPLIETLVGLIE